jgi:hypothetical protein
VAGSCEQDNEPLGSIKESFLTRSATISLSRRTLLVTFKIV